VVENCPCCGFSDLNKEFINIDEARIWEESVLKQCKNIYEKMSERLLREQKIVLSYDVFMKKYGKSGRWEFDDEIIHRKIDLYRYHLVNTFFCEYDNPPIEIIRFIAKKEGSKYEMIVHVRNLSKETRNQPIKFRYKIITPDGYNIHDCVDSVTPAPESESFTITFEYSGDAKPVFEIIE
jgi:hypothetical protein